MSKQRQLETRGAKMDREWVKPKKNTAGILFVVLAALAFAAAAYFFFDITTVNAKAQQLITTDYTQMNAYAQKGALAPATGVPLTQQPEQEAQTSVFVTPLGFPIISYSEKWTDEKLVSIYEELIRNEHGNEIFAVSSVLLHPGQAETGGVEVAVAGTHITQHIEYPVYFHLPGVVPSSLRYDIRGKKSVIELYNMDEYQSVDEVAKTMAHEYGHHYTMYYFMQSDEAVLESEYYRMRGAADFGRQVFFDSDEDYFTNHMWSIYELAAEDYVQLMGSPNAKKPQSYLDVFDVLESSKQDYKIFANPSTYNVYPQENIYLPLADEIPRLRDYYYDFINKQNDLEAFEPFDFGLTITRKSSFGYVHYEITWNKPTNDKDAIYTLVCYDLDGQVFLPVRTVQGNAEPKARVGTATRTSGTTIYSMKLTGSAGEITDESRLFKLYVLWPDGRMQSSELFHADF